MEVPSPNMYWAGREGVWHRQLSAGRGAGKGGGGGKPKRVGGESGGARLLRGHRTADS